ECGSRERRHGVAVETRREQARAFVAARRAGDPTARAAAAAGLRAADHQVSQLRSEAVGLVRATDPKAQTSDTNYIFLDFVLHHLPVGVVRLVLAPLFPPST